MQVLLKQNWWQFYGERKPLSRAAPPWRSWGWGFRKATDGESDVFLYRGEFLKEILLSC